MQQIYNILYNHRFTKSERALKRIETIERGKIDTLESSDSSESTSDNEGHNEDYNDATLYPKLDEEQQAMPRINVDRLPPTKITFKDIVEKETLISKETTTNALHRPDRPPLSGVASEASSGQSKTSILLKKFVPNFISNLTQPEEKLTSKETRNNLKY